jgi:hypothetical protein
MSGSEQSRARIMLERPAYCGAQAARLTALPHGNIGRLQDILQQWRIAWKSPLRPVHRTVAGYRNCFQKT